MNLPLVYNPFRKILAERMKKKEKNRFFFLFDTACFPEFEYMLFIL